MYSTLEYFKIGNDLPQMFKCYLCKKTFAQKRYLKSHLTRCVQLKNTFQTPQQHRCSKCDKIFTKFVELKRHELHHSKIKKLACSSCDRSFVQKAHLKRHIDTVHGKAKNFHHKCQCCETSFATKWQTERHERTMHAFASNLYKCRFCGEKFDNQRLYINHLEFHKGLKLFSCEVCGMAFQRKTELEAHSSAKHGRGFCFVCVKCDQCFNQRTQINRHIVKEHPSSHSVDESSMNDEQFFYCHYCSENFLEKKNLLDHINEQHFRKIYRSCTTTTDDKMKTTVPPLLNVEKSSSSSSSSVVLEWKTINVMINFENDFIPNSRLMLGRSLPQNFLSQNPSLSKLEVDLTPHVCNPGETIVVQVPVKVDSTKAADLPTSLHINYVN